MKKHKHRTHVLQNQNTMDSDSYLFPKSQSLQFFVKFLDDIQVELPYIVGLFCCSYFHRVDPPIFCDTIFSKRPVELSSTIITLF